MIRNQYSYWLTAKCPGKHPLVPAQTVLDALNQSDLTAPEGPMVFELNADGSIQGQVQPDWGTVAKDDDLLAIVTDLAARFPTWDFAWQENDEEDHANSSLTRFEDGEQVFQGFTRVVGPGELDFVTIRTVVEYLNNHGWPDAATAVSQHVTAPN